MVPNYNLGSCDATKIERPPLKNANPLLQAKVASTVLVANMANTDLCRRLTEDVGAMSADMFYTRFNLSGDDHVNICLVVGVYVPVVLWG